MAELRRLLLSPKQLVILLMLTVINLALFASNCRSIQENLTEYRKVQWEEGIDSAAAEKKEAAAYLKSGYAEYLQYVQEQSKKQGLLGKLSEKNSFITRNLEKTAKDYAKLEGIELTQGQNRGLLAVSTYTVTDFLLLIAPLLLAIELAHESETAIGALARTTKNGHLALCIRRIAAIALLSAASVLCMYCGNMLYARRFFGSAGLHRMLQSVPEFQLCSMRITIGGYYFATAIIKCIAVTATALFLWIILSRFYKILSWLIAAPVLILHYLTGRLVMPTSSFNHLRYLNVFSALHTSMFFKEYCNLNWFGHASGFFADMLIFLILTLLILTGLSLYLIGHCHPVRIGQKLEQLKEQIEKRMAKHMPAYSVFGFEGWKLLIPQHVLLIAAVFSILVVFLWNDMFLYAPSVDTQKFYERYSGEITQAKIERIARQVIGETNRINVEKRNYQRNIEQGHYQDAAWNDEQITICNFYLERYETMMDEMISLAKYKKKTGNEAWFLDDDTYEKVFNENAAEERCCLVLLLFLILAFYASGAFDNRYDTRMLLRSTKNGRAGILTSQIIWCAILTAIAVTALHGIFLLRVSGDIGFPMMEAPAQSIPAFRDLPFSVSLRTCIIVLMCLRFLAAMVISGAVMVISRFSKTPQRALMVSMVLLILPTALSQSGILPVHFLDFAHFLSCCKR
ncbi:MAG: hypothetical protein IKI77_07260 [Oscillospiraceae bacterium]|nr:hypothetical protein [Oscillospiraceae bacterium]